MAITELLEGFVFDETYPKSFCSKKRANSLFLIRIGFLHTLLNQSWNEFVTDVINSGDIGVNSDVTVGKAGTKTSMLLYIKYLYNDSISLYVLLTFL